MTTQADDFEDHDADRAYRSLAPSDGADFGDDVEPARTTLLADMLDTYFTDLERAVPPVQWPVGEGWGTLAFRPHSVMVIGGPVNVGKTPLMMNLLWQAMQITPSLRVLVANNESMVPELIETLTAMLGGINLRDVQARDPSRCTPEKLAVARVLTAVENGGAGTVSRRSKMAAHNRAVLCEGTIGATAPITPFSRERHRSAQRHGDLERDTT